MLARSRDAVAADSAYRVTGLVWGDIYGATTRVYWGTREKIFRLLRQASFICSMTVKIFYINKEKSTISGNPARPGAVLVLHAVSLLDECPAI